MKSQVVVDMLAPAWRPEPTKAELGAQLRWFIAQYERLTTEAPSQIAALRASGNTQAVQRLERELATAEKNLPIARAELAELEAETVAAS